MSSAKIRNTSSEAGGDNNSGSSGTMNARQKRDEVFAMIHDFLRTRPKHIQDKRGHSGREITCVTNYIPVVTKPDWTLYQYHVNFSPPVDSKMIRNKLIHDHADIFGRELIFDGLILYLPFDLPQRETTLKSVNPVTGGSVTLIVKRTNELPPGDPQCITLFNLCNRKAFQLKDFRQLGRHFYDPSNSGTIEKHRIEIWPGFISAIRCQEEDLLMCCEMSHKILRIDTVLDFMYDLYNSSKDGRFKETLHSNSGRNQRAHSVGTLFPCSLLQKLMVFVRYNNKIYRIDDIIWDKHPTEEFQMQNGRTLTLAEYYKEQYNRVIKDKDQPLLLSRAKKRGDVAPGETSTRDVYLIPELCAMTGLTEEMRTDRRVMQDLAQYTRVPPDKRIEHTRQYLRSLIDSKEIQQLFATWSLSFGEDVASVKARVLPQEDLIDGDEKTFKYSPVTGDWARESRGVKLTERMSLSHWVFIFPKADKSKAEEFFRSIQNIGTKIGMRIEKPEIVPLDCDRTSTYLEAIKFGRENEPKAQMVVCMVPNDNKTRYDAIKKLCCLDEPVPNQIIRSQTLARNVISVCTKVILQMNCKLGGSLWRVHIPMKTAMVIGYDAYHDSANRGKSVGAAVFSLDPGMTRWYSQCALHKESEELICNLTLFCEKGLKKYYETNGCLPERIFLFRDGCGDGQIPLVYSQELPQVQSAVKNVGRTMSLDYKPKLSFIIVTKRVNTRFFEQQTGGTLSNPPPGTVVDSVVTRRERYDFFLVPQCVRQGTVTPVSYNVILDDSGLTPDQMQRFAYKLCHLYYNWQGTIRVPAPCQYAHKLAFLVGQSLHKPADEFLADKLYFL